MSAFHDNALMGASGQQGYQISRSVRLRSSASAYFNRTPASAGNRKTWTWSGWVKRGSLSTAYNQYLFSAVPSASVRDGIMFNTSSGLSVFANDGSSAWLATTQVFRDVSAWYHIVVAVDTTQATSSNRMKVYLNGSQITSFSTATYPSQNYDWGFDNNVRHTIGDDAANAPTGTYHFDGYLTEVNFIDGQALTPSSFGETDTITGVWKPKKYAGTYGTNGFYLNFSDNSNNTATTIGKDYSGNGNNWTPNNISVTSGVTYDSMLDTPTPYADGGNGRGNYAVVNPLPPSNSGGSWYTQNGNLSLVRSGSGWITGVATIGVTSGKWYWEVIPQNSGDQFTIGVAKDGYDWTNYLGSNAFGWSYDGTSGASQKYNNGTGTSYGSSYVANDVIGVAFDADAGTLTFYKNNVSQGQAFSGLTSGPYYPASGVKNLNSVAIFNFGQRPFAYTPPSGFKALNTQNLPEPTISNGALYMAATTYTGNGGTQSITNTVNGVSFKPDLVWIKTRSATSYHQLIDSVRGVSTVLNSNYTGAESSYPGYSVTAFNSNGFTVVDDAAASYGVNGSTGSPTYVGWQWRAGQGTTSSNTSGSITSTVSVNATAGFSVVTYTTTGSAGTVGHGLGVAPSMIILKNRSGAADDWYVYHDSLGNTKYLTLDTTAASTTASTWWNSTSPTSTVFSLGSAWSVVKNYVAYCFSAVRGYSAFGSYTGNGSATGDGPFVYLGFRPRFVMLKITTTAGYYWMIKDSSRDPYNTTSHELYANVSDAEYTASSYQLDFLSNGFKIKNSGQAYNGSGDTYIYAAFAENPLKFSLAR